MRAALLAPLGLILLLVLVVWCAIALVFPAAAITEADRETWS